MKRLHPARLLVPLLLTATIVAAGPGATPELTAAGAAGDTPRREPIHGDPVALERATLDATTALLRNDARATREALDRIEAHCRRLMPEEDLTYTKDIVIVDQGMHKPLTLAREEATRGDLDEALNMFVWVLRSCRSCHRLAAEAGKMPSSHPPAAAAPPAGQPR
jgi:hypothetical protein